RLKALELARTTVTTVASDYELADIWLMLEGAYGDREKALARRAEQFRRTPTDRDNAMKLAELYLQLKRADESKPVIDAIRQGTPDLAGTQLLAQYHALRGEKAAATKVYDDYLSALPEAERNQLVLWFDYARFASDRLRDPALAASILERVRNLQRPDEMEVDRELGDIHFAVGEFDKACAAYQRALDSVKIDVNNLIRFRMIEGRLRLKQYEEADRLCLQAEQAGIKDNAQLCMLRSEAKIGVKDLPGAAALLDTAVRLDPRSPLPFYKRAQVRLVDPNQLNDAIGDLRQSVNLAPGFYAARRVLSEVLSSTGQVAESVDVLRQGVSQNPGDGQLRHDLIMKLHQNGDGRGAVQELEEAMKRSNDPQWFVIGAELARLDGNLPKAVEYYGRAFSGGLKTNVVTAPYVRALLDQARPDTEAARRVLADPDVPTEKMPLLLMARARVNWLDRRQNDAVKDLRTVYGMMDSKIAEQVKGFVEGIIEIAPRAADSLAIIDQFRPSEGFPESVRFQIIRIKLTDTALVREGLKELDEFVERNNKPEHKEELVRALKFLGDLMYAQRRYEQAAESYRRGLTVASDDPEFANNLAYTLCKHLKRCDEALPHAEKAVTIAPGNPNILDTLGVIQLSLSQNDAALATFDKALGAAKVPLAIVPILLHRSDALLARNERDKAQTTFDQVQREILKDPKVGVLYAAEIDLTRKRLAGR
ncbi:MAG: tetratricopeptide repeat protein, partial [Phycisphaerales bacterium]